MDDTLSQMIPDDELFRAAWQKRPVVFSPTAFRMPLSLSDIELAISSGLLGVPYLELVTAEGTVSPYDYCVPRQLRHQTVTGYLDPAAVRRFVDDGATTLLRNVEHWHAPVTAMCASLSAELGKHVEAFAFVTPPGTQGRPVHTDDADVVVLQIAGTKTWQIYGLPADGDGTSGLVDDPGPVVLRPALRPGDVLYVPRGSPHEARADHAGYSAHLSFTIRDVSTADLVRAAHESFGTALPVKPLGDAALLAVAAQVLDGLRAHLDELTPESLLAAARAAMASRQVPVAQPFSF